MILWFNLHTRQNCANFLISLCNFLNISLKQQDDNSLVNFLTSLELFNLMKNELSQMQEF